MALLTLIGSTSWHERPGGLSGSICLVPFTPVDMGRGESWLEEPHVLKWWVTGRGTVAERLERHRSGFIESMEMPELAPFIIRIGEERIGFLLLRHVNALQARGLSGWQSYQTPFETIGVDLFIGEPQHMGKGYARRAIRLGVEAAFADQMVVKLIADPAPRNAAAIASFTAAGFVMQGSAITPHGAATLMSHERGHGTGKFNPPRP